VGILEKSRSLRIGALLVRHVHILRLITPVSRPFSRPVPGRRRVWATAVFWFKLEFPDWSTAPKPSPHPRNPGSPIAKQLRRTRSHSFQACSGRSHNTIAIWGIAVHPASALDCAQSRESSATGKPVKKFCAFFGQIMSKIVTLPLEETRKARKTQCSRAALCLCPIPNSVSLLSPIQSSLLRSSPPSTSGPPAQKVWHSLTLRHLTAVTNRRQSAWLCPGTNACVPLACLKARQPAPLHS